MAVVTKSIIVPCYNEAANLPALISRFEVLRTQDSDWELVLVNNGSTDDTAAVLVQEVASPSRSFIRVVTVPAPNVGYGHGIVTGLRAAKGQWLAWTHADGQTRPGDVLAAFELLTTSQDPQRTLVKGRRVNRPVKDELFTRGMQTVAHVVLGENLVDINGQPKAFPRALLDLATAPPIDLSLDLYFLWLTRVHKFEVRCFDVSFGAREHGESKWAASWKSKARNIARTVKFMAALRGGGEYPQA